MRWSLGLVLLLSVAGLAGCLSDDDRPDGAEQVEDDVMHSGSPGRRYLSGNLTIPDGGLFAGPALYPDPQNAPHPDWNWPTITYPATGPNVPYWWQPINGTSVPPTITALEHVAQTPDLVDGAGIALFGRLAVVPGNNAQSAVVDISDPALPKVLSMIDSQLGGHRGAVIIAYPTGRLVTVISTGNGLDVHDITDPTAPQNLTPITVGSHKVGVVPGSPIVFNAASSGGSSTDPEASTGITQMWDFSDPEDVVPLADFTNGYSCHHIYFWNNVTEEKYRAVCAGIQYTQIIDTADPYNPAVIVSVPYGHGMTQYPSGSVPLEAFSHYAGLSMDGKVLLVGDENGGGLAPPGCVVRVDIPGQGSVSVPIGAVWFYDVSTETEPALLGWFSASQHEKFRNPTNPAGAPASCTAHHGRLIPVEGRDVLAMSFYGAGVVVVDFTGMRNEQLGTAELLAQFSDGSNTWETWYYNGYLFTGDLNRGMDVLRLV